MPDSSVTTPPLVRRHRAGDQGGRLTPRSRNCAPTAWVDARGRLPFGERRQGRKLALRPGQRWSKAAFDCAWFHFTGTVPPAVAGKQIVLLIDLERRGLRRRCGGPAAARVDPASVPASRASPASRESASCRSARGGRRRDRSISGFEGRAANDLFGIRRNNGVLQEAAIAIRNPELYALHYDFEVCTRCCSNCPTTAAVRCSCAVRWKKPEDLLRDFTKEEAVAARPVLRPELARRNKAAPLTVWAVGHAHMDLAWLWPIRETIRKCGPHLRDGAGDAGALSRLHFRRQPGRSNMHGSRSTTPRSTRASKQRVAEGRWEVQGAMWVESDIQRPPAASR